MEYEQISSNITSYPLDYRKIYEKLISLLEELKEKIYAGTINAMSKKNKNHINRLISELKESFEKLDKTLSQLENYKKEYLRFLSIKRMAFYILEDSTLFEHIVSIEKLFNSFCNIAYLKNAATDEEYEKYYKEFEKELLNFEQFFYTEVCKPSESYNEETLSSITNSLLN